MTLLERVQARVETDLDEEELGSLISEAQEVIQLRYGPAAGEDPIAVTLPGHSRTLSLARPADLGKLQDMVVRNVGTGTLFTSDDFVVTNGGRTLERRHPYGWPRLVKVEYHPVDDTLAREEAVIKLVQLAIEFHGVDASRVGDTSTTYSNYAEGKEAILADLAPRKMFVA